MSSTGRRTYYIQGRVFDATSNEPVNQATVMLTRLGGAPLQQTITDSMGNFFFSDLPSGTYEVDVRAQGYRDGRESVQLTIGPNPGVSISLQPRVEAAKPAIVEPLSAEEQLAPDEAKDLYKKGVEAFRQRRLEDSRAHFEKAIQLFPRFASAHSGLGVVLLELSDVAGAQAALESAIEINPNFAPPRVYLGALHNALHRYQEAVEHLRTATILRPNSWMAHFELSRSFWALGDIDKAENHALRAHELQKRVPQVHLMLANVHMARNNSAAALKEMDEALALSPDGPMADMVRQRRTELTAQMKAPKP
ncbi:MAG: tetratricopeptide repeat protein [Acidobacteria bacterium]|nr:tetratricopeptide repeat protein [Acidobacteriota bacterium]